MCQFQIDESVLGIQTKGGRMEGTDESTDLLRHPYDCYLKPRSD